jgi:DNA-directed RNA polymerase I subunit RPA1
MEDSETVRACALVIKGGLAEDKMKSIQALVDTRIPGKQEMTYKLHVGYRNLQRRVNVLFDMQLDRMEKNKTAGLRQVLEKKEGLFRKHMMGKRVNYACRSVITPDPYIAVDEVRARTSLSVRARICVQVGVPIVFARRLTFPEYVNNINLPNLRQMVYRGPDNYPG